MKKMILILSSKMHRLFRVKNNKILSQDIFYCLNDLKGHLLKNKNDSLEIIVDGSFDFSFESLAKLSWFEKRKVLKANAKHLGEVLSTTTIVANHLVTMRYKGDDFAIKSFLNDVENPILSIQFLPEILLKKTQDKKEKNVLFVFGELGAFRILFVNDGAIQLMRLIENEDTLEQEIERSIAYISKKENVSFFKIVSHLDLHFFRMALELEDVCITLDEHFFQKEDFWQEIVFWVQSEKKKNISSLKRIKKDFWNFIFPQQLTRVCQRAMPVLLVVLLVMFFYENNLSKKYDELLVLSQKAQSEKIFDVSDVDAFFKLEKLSFNNFQRATYVQEVLGTFFSQGFFCSEVLFNDEEGFFKVEFYPKKISSQESVKKEFLKGVQFVQESLKGVSLKVIKHPFDMEGSSNLVQKNDQEEGGHSQTTAHFVLKILLPKRESL